MAYPRVSTYLSEGTATFSGDTPAFSFVIALDNNGNAGAMVNTDRDYDPSTCSGTGTLSSPDGIVPAPYRPLVDRDTSVNCLRNGVTTKCTLRVTTTGRLMILDEIVSGETFKVEAGCFGYQR